MNATVGFGVTGAKDWQTLSADEYDYGYKVREVDGSFRQSSRNEALTRFLGVLIVLGALIQWLIPNADFINDPLTTKTLLTVAFSLVGLAVYTHASRGHRTELTLDPVHHQISVANLNRREQTRSEKRIPLDEIKSIYVRAPKDAGGLASLQVRLKNRTDEVSAIRGELSEIETLHRHLCRDIRLTRGV